MELYFIFRPHTTSTFSAFINWPISSPSSARPDDILSYPFALLIFND